MLKILVLKYKKIKKYFSVKIQKNKKKHFSVKIQI